jgi:hypothetical protein
MPGDWSPASVIQIDLTRVTWIGFLAEFPTDQQTQMVSAG